MNASTYSIPIFATAWLLFLVTSLLDQTYASRIIPIGIAAELLCYLTKATLFETAASVTWLLTTLLITCDATDCCNDSGEVDWLWMYPGVCRDTSVFATTPLLVLSGATVILSLTREKLSTRSIVAFAKFTLVNINGTNDNWVGAGVGAISLLLVVAETNKDWTYLVDLVAYFTSFANRRPAQDDFSQSLLTASLFTVLFANAFSSRPQMQLTLDAAKIFLLVTRVIFAALFYIRIDAGFEASTRVLLLVSVDVVNATIMREGMLNNATWFCCATFLLFITQLDAVAIALDNPTRAFPESVPMQYLLGVVFLASASCGLCLWNSSSLRLDVV